MLNIQIDVVKLILSTPAFVLLLLALITYVKENIKYEKYYNEHHKTVKKTKGSHIV